VFLGVEVLRQEELAPAKAGGQTCVETLGRSLACRGSEGYAIDQPDNLDGNSGFVTLDIHPFA